MPANSGFYAITGNNANFARTFAYNLSAIAGSYAITGQNAILSNADIYVLNAQTGSYTITGKEAHFEYNPAPIFIVESKGGLPKAKSSKKHEEEKARREELEALVKLEFDKLDGTYVPEIVEKTKTVFIPKLKKVD